ncbi:MAG: hypothetical protein IAE65_00710 [Ignavibacteria bacterium]|nr:hypothetical protein [Ignavibacteria bacterium]
MKIKYSILTLLVLTFLTVNLSFAQKDNFKFSDEVNKVLKSKLMEKLSIDENTAEKYLTLTKNFQSSIRTLSSNQKKIYKELESNLDSPDLSSKIDEITNIDIQIANQKKEYYNNLKSIFTPKQIAQSIILQRDLFKKVKSEVDKRKKKKKRD